MYLYETTCWLPWEMGVGGDGGHICWSYWLFQTSSLHHLLPFVYVLLCFHKLDHKPTGPGPHSILINGSFLLGFLRDHPYYGVLSDPGPQKSLWSSHPESIPSLLQALVASVKVLPTFCPISISFTSSSREEAPWGKELSHFSQYTGQGLRKRLWMEWPVLVQ